ncbi:hypothetical protein BDR04DRAFT_1161475 [Suillus decipiens]|nr:hypothetical protein BDR04DRAFT_1161475 [Suillus decipiens]
MAVKCSMGLSPIPLPTIDFNNLTHMTPADLLELPGSHNLGNGASFPVVDPSSTLEPKALPCNLKDFKDETASCRSLEREEKENMGTEEGDYEKKRKEVSTTTAVLPMLPRVYITKPLTSPPSNSLTQMPNVSEEKVSSEAMLFHQAVKTVLNI